MLTATLSKMEYMGQTWGGGMHSEGPGGFWPYIGVDRAVSPGGPLALAAASRPPTTSSLTRRRPHGACAAARG